ncbi:MAG: hypothetical protein ABI377_09025 [Devosia sp.]
MPLTLAGHLALIEDEYGAALKAPLSARKTLLVIVLLDNFADRVFEAFRFAAPAKVFDAEDLPAFRVELREHAPALGLIFDLAATRQHGPRLVTRTVEVPIADYPKLSVEDFMVSLYNRHTVQRVMIAAADAPDRLALEVIGEAIAWWHAFGIAA